MLQGLKRAEYRKNDRCFQVGDVLNIAGIEQGSRFLTSQFGTTLPYTDLEPGPVLGRQVRGDLPPVYVPLVKLEV